VVREDGAVLLQHRDNKKGVFYPDHWCYPGGVVEKDEPFEESAKRELFEETGYVAKIIFPLQAPDYLRTDGEVMCPHAFWTLYDGKQKIRCNEGREIVFNQEPRGRASGYEPEDAWDYNSLSCLSGDVFPWLSTYFLTAFQLARSPTVAK